MDASSLRACIRRWTATANSTAFTDRCERRHDAVAGVLDLAAIMRDELTPDDLVVLVEQLHVAVIAELLGLGDRPAHVRERDRSQGRSGVRGADRMKRQRSEQRVQRGVAIEFQDRAGSRPWIPVHGLDRIFARSFGEAEDRPVLGIEPIRVVSHTVPLFDAHIGCVGVGQLLGRDSRRVVTVDVHRHQSQPLETARRSAKRP